MVSKNQLKLITALHQKKYRQREGLFIAEGAKVIAELLRANFNLRSLLETESVFPEVPPNKKLVVSAAELAKVSALSAANNCLGVFEIPSDKPVNATGLVVALDDIRDPGNFGTILRLCDWFGVEQVVCSAQTVDLYNPKVIQATMGSVARVRVAYTDLDAFLESSHLPVFGTFMDGENIYSNPLPESAIVVMGNEANGISAALEKYIAHRIAIPRFGDLQQTESLNVATATAITLSEFRRSKAV